MVVKIACICCTYLRPVQLANAIACFESQTYENCELLVLDDAGQYENCSGPRWTLISVSTRFRTLGEKRNATAALCNADAYCVWDDDDIYLPWHVAAAAKALEHGDFGLPSEILISKGPKFERKKTLGLFHGGWSFKRDLFSKVHGYPFMQSGQDQGLFRRFHGCKRVDPLDYDPRLSYGYRWFAYAKAYHLSAMGKGGYEKLNRQVTEKVRMIPKFEKDWGKLCGHQLRSLNTQVHQKTSASDV